MFDVGFSEMVVIAVVALIVIGPERLPKLARTIGHLMGRMNRYVADVKADINREMEVDELRKFKEQFQDAAQSVEQTIHEGVKGAQSSLNKLEESMTASGNAVTAQETAVAGAADSSSDTSITSGASPADSTSPKISAT